MKKEPFPPPPSPAEIWKDKVPDENRTDKSILRPTVGEQVCSLLILALGVCLLGAKSLIDDRPDRFGASRAVTSLAFAALVFAALISRLVQLLLGSHRLDIDSDGLTIRSLWRRRRYDWFRVESIRIRSPALLPMAFDRVELHLTNRPGLLCSRTVLLPYLYGLTPPELVDRLLEHASRKAA